MKTVVNASREDERLVLTIDRTERRNALNAEVIRALWSQAVRDVTDRAGGHDPADAELLTVRTGLAADVVERQRGAVQAVGVLAQGPVQLVVEVLEVVHRSSSRSAGLRWAGVRSRSVARARLVWDFTVPTEMPSTSAVSASLSSS